MKKIKGIMLVLFSFLLITLTVPAAPVKAAEIRYGKTVISQMENQEALSYVYNRLVDVCKKDKPEQITINTSYKLTSEELVDIYHIFLADYPEYFWLDGSLQYANSPNNGYVCLVIPSYSMTGSSLKNAKDAFEKKVNSLIQGLNGKSEYEKSLILHDRLAENTDYISTNNDQNAYGALVECKAVCAGYSKAYQHLLHKVGIPAWCVMGTSEDPISHQPQNHEWNLVSVDGKWYYTDVTWDDQEYLFYAYLNITTEQLEEDHTITEFEKYLPDATSTDANYFAKNNLVYSSFDIDRLANQLKADNYKTRLYVNGNKQSFINNLGRNIHKLIQKTGIPADYDCSYSTVSIGGEIDLYVTLIEPNHKHNPTLVSAKNATCTSRGSIAYYTCSCGKWFSDATAQSEITDKQSVEIAAVAHVASGWKNDNINHWRNCINCGVEMANSMNLHTDSDSNFVCDVCAYSLPKDQIAATPSGTTQNTQNKNNDSSTNSSTPSTPTESTAVSENTSTEETVNEEAASSETEENLTNEPKPKMKDISLLIAIATGSIAVLGGAGTGIFFILRRK